MRDFHVAVISSGRPQNVQRMHELLEMEPVWYVGKKDAKSYLAAGATELVVGGGLCESRNRALDDAFSQDLYSVQLSDDLRKLKFYSPDDSVSRAQRFTNLRFIKALKYMRQALENTPYKMAGTACTTNEMNYKDEFQYRHYILGDFVLIAPSEPRFDEGLTLKEDYDFTCQHLAKYGGVVRCCGVIPDFVHRTNPGGAVAIRTDEEELKNIDLLMAKWPRGLVRHRKPTEVILRWRYPVDEAG